MHKETVWTFETARFRVALEITREYNYQYDGDDEDGSIQDAIYRGELIAWHATVVVRLDGRVIANDYLGGSVYGADEVDHFWTDHRCADPMNRNCSIMRAARGGNVVICHYFPDMVRTAVDEARKALANIPYLRAA